MKVVTWNINGIRTFRGGIKKALDSLNADIICVQETKVTSKWLAQEFGKRGSCYVAYHRSRRDEKVKPQFVPHRRLA